MSVCDHNGLLCVFAKRFTRLVSSTIMMSGFRVGVAVCTCWEVREWLCGGGDLLGLRLALCV